jgi:hypothetical protein
MKNASPIPGTIAKNDDLFGSALGVATVIHIAWPNLFRCQNPASALFRRDVRKSKGSAKLRGRLRALHTAILHGFSTSGIAHWEWRAIYPATRSLGMKNSTPSPASSARPWIAFCLVSDRLGQWADSQPSNLFVFSPHIPD